jgi:two-component system response regulator ResD
MNENTEKKNINILIVDDDKFLLDMYSIKFGEHGFDVTSCLGSVEAYEKLKAHEIEPDVMLLDVVMPTMDGFEFLEKVNKENLIGETVVIMLTNLGQEEDVKRGRALGAKGYIVKASATPTEVVQEVSSLANIPESQKIYHDDSVNIMIEPEIEKKEDI